MKRVGFIFLILLNCISCNNDTPKEQAKPPTDDNYVVNLKKSIEQYPDSILLKRTLIDYYHDKSNDSLAMVVADDALETDSLNAYWWDLKARLYDQFDTVNIIKSWEKAVQLSPLPEYLSSLGYMYAHAGNAKAIPVGDVLTQSGKTTKEGLLIKGIYYNRTGDKFKAIQFFDEALKASYTFMVAYREKAIALYDLGKYTDAIAVLEKALTVQSNYDEAYFWIGRCYEKLNRLNEAKENYQLAIKAAAQAKEDYPEAAEALDSVESKLQTTKP